MGHFNEEEQSRSSSKAQTMKQYPRVNLLPWDPTSEAHVQRMYDQRVACTWDYQEVEDWKQRVINGQKTMYWVVLDDDEETIDTKSLITKHVRAYPKESQKLIDSAQQVASLERDPSAKEFLPVGHVALEALPKLDAEFHLPPRTQWLKSLYLSWELQSVGLGRSTMIALEKLARGPQFRSSVIALDTVTKEFELMEERLAIFFDERGVPRPNTVRTNEEWYMRQGYELMGSQEDAGRWVSPATGKSYVVPLVFLKKTLV